MLESDYTHARYPKRAPELPLRVFNKSQLIAALRQHSRPIVIEDPDLVLPFTRMLRLDCRRSAFAGTIAPGSRRTGISVNMFFQETCTELS